jgi:polyether ionophore transport system permease protein
VIAPANALVRRTLADSRIRDGCFALVLGLIAYANPVGYRHSYPRLDQRLAFARSFGTNKAVELFYGAPRDLLTVGGFTSWRFGGFAAVVTATWGVLASVRALRGEEDAGRQELVLAGALSRRSAFLAVVVAVATAGLLIWLAVVIALAAAGLPVGGSAYLGVVTLAPAFVFAGVGAVARQLAASRRGAIEIAVAVLAASYLLRVVADIGGGLGWLRWATPLGWGEEMRAFAEPRPAVLLLPASATALLFAAAGLLTVGRDVGTGILAGRDSAAPNLRLLSSPTAHAFRSSRGSVLTWLVGTGVFAAVIGVLSTSFTTANISANLRAELHKLGGATITTPAGALGFQFLFFVLAISLYACTQVAAMRREEADQQLETIFALPVGRRPWLLGRLTLAAAVMAALALAAALLAWAGSASQHAHVSFARMLEAGVNCLPTALLFLGLATLAFALVPRASSGLAYGLVTLSFVWQLFGSLLGAPHWLLDATPFQHVALVPAQPFRAAAAAVMLAVGTAAALAGLYLFGRRDLASA